jgi:hypothetical protein
MDRALVTYQLIVKNLENKTVYYKKMLIVNKQYFGQMSESCTLPYCKIEAKS